MMAALTPELALARLGEFQRSVREAVVLDGAGNRLAGSPAVAEPARQLLSSTDGAELEVATGRGVVYAARTPRHAIAVVSSRGVLPALMLFDMRRLLAELDEAKP
jgi:hypothetical protein